MPDISAMLRDVAPRTRDLKQPALIAQVVRAQREQLNLTQEDLGVGRSTVSNLETGSQVRYQSAKLATIGGRLQLPPDWIERIEAGEELALHGERAAAVDDRTTSRLDALEAGVRELRRSMQELVGHANPRIDKSDEMVGDLLPELIARIERLEAQGRGEASG